MTQIGRYEILEELGRGGFATVYRARDSQLKRLVALKVLHEGWSSDPEFARRFRQEAETVANLRHPNIVVVHDVGEIDRQLFIAMEFLPGEDLRSWLTRREDPLTVAQTVAILEPVAGALDYAHEQGMVHRDIKPGNMMIDEQGTSRRMALTDFGLVKAMESSVALTRAGQMLGSPEYMAPEQADPNRQDEIGAHTDNYSFGIVAYQMLAGRVPFPGNSISTLNAHVNLPVPSPQEFNEALPEDVTAVLLKMLAKEPADRYPSAVAFVDALRKTTLTDGQEEVEQLYGQLQKARTEGDWVEVVSLAARIETMQPGYRDVRQWQAEARRQLTRPVPLQSEKTTVRTAPPPEANAVVSPQAPSQTVETTVEEPGKGKSELGSGIKPVHILGIAGGLVVIVLIIGLVALVISLGDGQDEEQAGTTTAIAAEKSEQTTTMPGAPATATILTTEEVAQATIELASPPPTEPTPDPTSTATKIPVQPTAVTTLGGAVLPATGSLGDSWTRPADEMVMVYVPAGSFLMGSEQGDDDERPVHEVSLDAFWIDQTEVTNDQYSRCVADGGCEQSGWADDEAFNGDDQPVVGVSWFDAEAYCAWAGGQLPTEAQWEYAARDGEGSIYPWGDMSDCSRANVRDCADFGIPAPVGSYPDGASWVGAYDMAGNVWERVADWYGSDYYDNSPSHNPLGPASGAYRVTRGGSWDYNWEDARSSSRGGSGPDSINNRDGFRCAAAPSGASLGDTRTRPADDMVMVYVPAGSFLMGSDQGSDNERPVHEVSLDAFWIDQTEVTNALYNRCVTDGECDESELANDGDYNRDDQPVVGVNWFDAEAYCEWAGGQLPTEAQWEYAARGEEGSVYPWGDEFDGQLLNFCDTNCTYDWQDTNYDDGFELTAPVGNYSNGASWVGAYDMAGNVWEYVADRYDSGYYWDSPSHNPTGSASGDSRVLRGGSWVSRSQDARSSVRTSLDPAGWGDAFGFRCAAPGP